MEDPHVLLEALMQYVPAGVVIASHPDVRIIRVSDYVSRTLGRPRSELENIPVDKHVEAYRVLDPQTGEPASPDSLPLTRATRGEVVEDEECILATADGTRLTLLCNAGPIRDVSGQLIGGILVWRDVSKSKRLMNELEKASRNREVLLRELNHRLKNFFQLLTSLLMLQAQMSKSPLARDELRKAAHRVAALGSVQRYLRSEPGQEDRPDMRASIQELCSQVAELVPRKVELRFDISELPVGGQTARSLLLIVHELVTNACKYAFPGDLSGHVHVSLRQIAEGRAQLIVEDDGVGLGPDYQGGGSGLTLVQLLVEQLDGTLDICTQAGPKFSIVFPLRSRRAA